MDRREYEERYGEEVGRCAVHEVTIVDRNCEQCEDDRGSVCPECGESRPDSARVKAGMKCAQCAYCD
jgi:hypothetical protein